jgi:putative nucleotidyltransferase with HDIG domain
MQKTLRFLSFLPAQPENQKPETRNQKPERRRVATARRCNQPRGSGFWFLVSSSAIVSAVNKTRNDALALLHHYTKTDSLRKHALAVEQAMKACARKYAPGEDPLRWGMAGLLHDFDYEQFPNADQHPYVGSKILEENGFDDELRHAIMGHAPYTGVARASLMAKALFACDELCGFLTACSLVQPGKSLAEVKVASVKKKLKDKAFARTVSRDDIYNGVAELGVDLEEHIAFVREALLEIAEEIGVGGISAS